MFYKTIHRNLAEAVVQTLYRIFHEQKFADKEVERTLKSNKKWGSKDRKFIAESVYECVRWKRFFGALVNNENPQTVSDFWQILGVYLLENKMELPAWEEFSSLDKNKIEKISTALKEQSAVIQSIPDWLHELGLLELGEKWSSEISSLNQTAPVIIRVNTLKTDSQSLQKALEKENINTEIIANTQALKLLNRANVFQTLPFKNGWFEVQDISSQQVAEFLEVQSNMRVIDACAGAGGKTLHLSNLMHNKGQLIALDIHDYKLEELKRRAKRNACFNIETRVIDGTKTTKKLKNSADRVLIDAPCSGLGVLRRNPDAKWKLSPEQIENVKLTQAEILQNYSEMLKIGGKMVYATCSILPSENEKQVQHFLHQNQNFKLVNEKKISVFETGNDGFYMALLEKTS